MALVYRIDTRSPCPLQKSDRGLFGKLSWEVTCPQVVVSWLCPAVHQWAGTKEHANSRAVRCTHLGASGQVGDSAHQLSRCYYGV